MPQFRVKDLLINLGQDQVVINPQINLCQLVGTNFCGYHNATQICNYYNFTHPCHLVLQSHPCQYFPHSVPCLWYPRTNVLAPPDLRISPACPDPTPFRPDLSIGDLATLKAQLRTQLAAIEEQEEAMRASQQPQTLEEITQLETRLKEALQELEAMKGNMKQ